MKKLGYQAVIQACQSPKPWQQLKQLANQQVPAVRLILEDEFSQNIQTKTGGGSKVGTLKKPAKEGSHKPKPLTMSPADIFIPDGVFAQQDGQPLSHITMDQLSATAKGIVLMEEASFMPYRNQKHISKHGLAFLIMAPYSPEMDQYGTQIRLPARSTSTGEPVLMTACLVQKGEQSVARSVPTMKQSVDQVNTQVVKIMLYRDQADQPWETIMTKPIRYVLDHTPALQVCRQEDCSCQSWHMTDESPSEPIIDVWARDFTTLQYTKVKASEASVFTCHMRLTEEAFKQVIPLSSKAGIYYEPRTPDGRKHDPSYFTCWMAKQSYQEVQASKSTAPVACSIIRVQNRYGLCTHSQHGQQLHEHCKPGRVFLGHNAIWNAQRCHGQVVPAMAMASTSVAAFGPIQRQPWHHVASMFPCPARGLSVRHAAW